MSVFMLVVTVGLFIQLVLAYRKVRRNQESYARLLTLHMAALHRNAWMHAELLEILRGVFPYVDDVKVMASANDRLQAALNTYQKEAGDAVAP